MVKKKTKSKRMTVHLRNKIEKRVLIKYFYHLGRTASQEVKENRKRTS